MRRSYKFLLRPTVQQAAALAAMLGDHRHLYNCALEHRRTAYRLAEVRISYGAQSAELSAIRAEHPGSHGRWSFSSQQATLRRLDRAFAYNTSRTCARCGHCHAENRVTQAGFCCLACGHSAHADVNAARNILRAGLARQAAKAA